MLPTRVTHFHPIKKLTPLTLFCFFNYVGTLEEMKYCSWLHLHSVFLCQILWTPADMSFAGDMDFCQYCSECWYRWWKKVTETQIFLLIEFLSQLTVSAILWVGYVLIYGNNNICIKLDFKLCWDSTPLKTHPSVNIAAPKG